MPQVILYLLFTASQFVNLTPLIPFIRPPLRLDKPTPKEGLRPNSACVEHASYIRKDSEQKFNELQDLPESPSIPSQLKSD